MTSALLSGKDSNMTITLAQLAQLVDGQLHGDGDVEITGAAILRDAQAGEVTLCERAELAKRIDGCAAAAVLLPQGIATDRMPYVAVDNVVDAFTKIVFHFRPPRAGRSVGVSSDAHVSRFARCGEDVQIHPGASVGDDVAIGAGTTIHSGAQIMPGCKIGRHVTIFPGAVLYENTIVGDHCIIHANAVLGAYGFGYEMKDGRHQLSAQLGYVELQPHVDVGAATTIDRGTYGPTVIGEGTKLDNQVMIAHNCRIGRHNIICSQVGIAGSTTTGDYVVLAGQVGVCDHVHIGEAVKVGAQSGVSSAIPDGEIYLGSPATPIKQQKSRYAAYARMPEMRKEFRQLKREVEQLQAQLEAHRQTQREAA